VLQCLVLFVICHAEYPQPCLQDIHTFCKHHKSIDQNKQ
jgi:hypothetical protein